MANALIPAIRQPIQSNGYNLLLSEISKLDEISFNIASTKPAQLPAQSYRSQSTALARTAGGLFLRNLPDNIGYKEMIAACGPINQALKY